jgi:hypothetical protein
MLVTYGEESPSNINIFAIQILYYVARADRIVG